MLSMPGNCTQQKVMPRARSGSARNSSCSSADSALKLRNVDPLAGPHRVDQVLHGGGDAGPMRALPLTSAVPDSVRAVNA